MQITMGLPKPCEFSLMLRLHLVQSGIQRNHANQTSPKVRLPITPAILTKLKEHWSPQLTSRDIVMVWAAASVCFFRFWSGEFTIPSEKSFDCTKHLVWGDVSVDNSDNPQVVKVHLKRSKSDQLGKGVDVYMGKTDCSLCPVAAVTHNTWHSVAQKKARFSSSKMRVTSQSPHLQWKKRKPYSRWPTGTELCRTQFPHRRHNNCSQCRDRGPRDQSYGKVEQFSIPRVHS